MKKAFEVACETFSDIWLWTMLCVWALIPGCGIIIAMPIIGSINLILIALYLNPIAEWLCHSLYMDVGCSMEEIWGSMCVDIVRIWIITYVLIVLGRIVCDCYASHKETPT